MGGFGVGLEYFVETIHKQRIALVPGDWVIREPDGVHFYPCKPDIFEATYDKVQEAIGCGSCKYFLKQIEFNDDAEADRLRGSGFCWFPYEGGGSPRVQSRKNPCSKYQRKEEEISLAAIMQREAGKGKNSDG